MMRMWSLFSGKGSGSSESIQSMKKRLGREHRGEECGREGVSVEVLFSCS